MFQQERARLVVSRQRWHPRRFAILLETALLLALMVAVAGDPPPGVNEPHYLCRLKHFWDPGFATGDFFLNTPDAHFTVVWLLGGLTRVCSLEVTAWLLRLFGWGVLAWAWARLGLLVLKRPLAPTLAAGVFLLGIKEGNFCGEWVVGGFEAKCLAYAFVFLAMDAWLWGRLGTSAALLGAATALHALVGLWCGGMLTFCQLLGFGGKPSGPNKRLSRWGLMIGVVAGGLLSLAGIVPALLLQVGVPTETVDAANQIYVFDRLPHHLAPLHQPAEWLAERAGRHAIVLGLLWLTSQQLERSTTLPRPTRRRLRSVRWFAWIAVAVALVGLAIELALFNQPAQAAKLLRYYFFRTTDIAAPLALGFHLVALINDRIASRRRSGVWLLAVTLAIVCGWIGWLASDRKGELCPAADARLASPADWLETCAWIQEKTPQDAVFLVPTGTLSFGWHSGRGAVVTRKDIPQNAAGIVAWRERLTVVQDLEWRQTYDPEFGAYLAEVAHRYGANYWVTSREVCGGIAERSNSMSLAFVAGPYSVYKMVPAASQSTRAPKPTPPTEP